MIVLLGQEELRKYIVANNLQPGITIFTPTFNRAHLLGRLYESLLAQTSKELEWVVVDDGSTDNTRETIEGFSAAGQVNIRYIYKENGGKHTAMNVGIQYAQKEYFLCVDSDDWLVEGAVDMLLSYIADEKPAGIIAYKQEYPGGKRIGPDFPKNLKQTTLLELINTHHCAGDRTLVYKTEYLKTLKIPEPADQRFFPETWLYDRFDEQHACHLLAQDVCQCEYQTGGYSDSFRKLMIRNALSMKWFFADRIDMPATMAVRFDAAYRYLAFAMMARCPQGRYRGKNWPLLAAAFPAGLMMALSYCAHKK